MKYLQRTYEAIGFEPPDSPKARAELKRVEDRYGRPLLRGLATAQSSFSTWVSSMTGMVGEPVTSSAKDYCS
jgi:hypothetical protein